LVFEIKSQWCALIIYIFILVADIHTGRIPVIIDNTKTPPFPVIETSAQLLYLLKEYDSKDIFGFKDEYERSQCLQWLFFWHGSVYIHSIGDQVTRLTFVGCSY
jgi:glutathione S-transferase